jgi:3-oxoacyl-[acyl-carrier protein] reductase
MAMPPTSGELRGRRALVTGGSRGIGYAIAALLRDCGARVTVTGALSERRAPDDCAYEQVDFADVAATRAFAERHRDAGDVDILVNNAGINVVAPFAEISDDDFDTIHLVNLRAPMVLCRAVLPAMRERSWGRIVNLTSIFGVVSKTGRASYSSSKFGLAGMTAALAVEVAGDGVLANCVAPGFVDTELTRRVLGDAGVAEMIRSVPAGRLAQPEEIAHAVQFLASPRNSFITGQSLIVDGGFTST